MRDSILIQNGTLITMDRRDSVLKGDLLISDGRIADIDQRRVGAAIKIDASRCVVLPGFVQTHIHLCQTLFRGAADDLSLMDWLKTRIWPMEAAHTAASVRASARLGIAELIKGGTTTRALPTELPGQSFKKDREYREFLKELQLWLPRQDLSESSQKVVDCFVKRCIILRVEGGASAQT